MEKYLIKNSSIWSAILLFFGYAYFTELSLETIGWHIATGVGVTVVILVTMKLSLGGGTTKALGVAALWLGPVVHTLWFLVLCSVLMVVSAFVTGMFKGKDAGAPALPSILIAFFVVLVQTDTWLVFQKLANSLIS